MKPPIPPQSWTKPSVIMLILANMLPLYGAMFGGWSIEDIMLVFWMENVIIGVMNNVKFMTVATIGKTPSAIAAIPFFTFHYGLFTLVHGAFIMAFFGDGTHFAKGSISDGDMAYMGSLFLWGSPLFFAAFSLFVSHLFSYFVNFIGKGEYKSADPQILMFTPYGRVVVLHLTVLLGGAIVEFLGAPALALALLVVLKILLDLGAHVTEHEKAGKKESAAGEI